MQGADEYSKLFGNEQHGRLLFRSSSHARGATFHIYVLPEGVTVDNKMCWAPTDAVEVYGVVSGNPGWTETYGWLHHGKWVEDFEKLVNDRREEVTRTAAMKELQARQAVIDRQAKAEALLASYK